MKTLFRYRSMTITHHIDRGSRIPWAYDSSFVQHLPCIKRSYSSSSIRRQSYDCSPRRKAINLEQQFMAIQGALKCVCKRLTMTPPFQVDDDNPVCASSYSTARLSANGCSPAASSSQLLDRLFDMAEWPDLLMPQSYCDP